MNEKNQKITKQSCAYRGCASTCNAEILNSDEKLNFREHLKYIANKVDTSIGLLYKLQKCLSRLQLVTIYRSLSDLYLDCGDVVFDPVDNKSSHESLESFQYNASLAITAPVRGTSNENLYQELGFKSLQHNLYKIFKNESPH